MTETRPVPTNVFAENSNNIQSPSSAKTAAGYQQSAPFPSKEANALFHQITVMLKYLETTNTALWNADINYFQHARTRGTNGDIYRSKANDNINHNPVTDTAEEFWENQSKLLRDLVSSFNSHNHDDQYLGKTAKASDSDKFNGKTANSYALAHSHPYLGLISQGTKVYNAKVESSDELRIGFYENGWKNTLFIGNNKITYSSLSGGVYEIYHEGNKPTISDIGGLADAGVSLTQNGFQKFSNGLILQWGTQSTGVSSITFPIAFPTACLNIQISLSDATNSQLVAGYISSKNISKTKFDYGYSATWANRRWFAIGY